MNEINFTPYIPTTVLGLIGLLFGYLYGIYKNRNRSKIDQLERLDTKDRPKIIEMMINDLGVSIDTSGLNSKQKYELIVKLLGSKDRKYLIISLTSIGLSIIIALLIWKSQDSLQNETSSVTPIDTVVNPVDSPRVINPADPVTPIVKSTPPIFYWYELPTDKINSLSLTASAACDGCPPVTNVSKDWPNASVKASTGFSACNLPASSESFVAVESFKDANDKTTGLKIRGYVKSLAGWGGKGDGQSPYRPSNSGIDINAASGFEVKANSKYCLMVTKFQNSGSRAKGYDGSYLFDKEIYPDWPNSIGAIVSLESPSGKKQSLIPSTSIALNEIGLWKIKINGSINFNSGWSENSGTLSFEQELRLKFIKKYLDDSCPN